MVCIGIGLGGEALVHWPGHSVAVIVTLSKKVGILIMDFHFFIFY